MQKIFVFLFLFFLFLLYSFLVYTKGTATSAEIMSAEAINGKTLYQQYNCSACHQLYGLGGYLGPDLTSVIRERNYQEDNCKTLLKYGSQRMPDFHLNETEINDLTSYLKYIDKTALTYNINK